VTPQATDRLMSGTTSPAAAEPMSKLVASLVPELFQSERSAVNHGRREARRWAGTDPERALLAVAAHAERALEEWTSLCEARGHRSGGFGQAIGEAFSQTRDKLADAWVSGQLSYRGTLLGMRHGVDVVRFMQRCAEANGDEVLAATAARVHAERTVLVEDVAAALDWFAVHPKEALRRARLRP
jgi:hypothetical protein